MNPRSQRRLQYLSLGATLALGTTVALAAAPAPEGSTAEPPMLLAQAAPMPAPTAGRTLKVKPIAANAALPAGALRAAAQGVEPLRRYIARTQAIYGLYIYDFVIEG